MISLNTERSVKIDESGGGIAEHRHHSSGAYGPFAGPFASKWLAWLPLAVLPIATFATRSLVPAWAFMWALAFAMFAGFKWLTWWRARAAGAQQGWRRELTYLLLWPGMNAREFLNANLKPRRPNAGAWVGASMKTILGALLLWVVARFVPEQYSILTGWIGLLGLIFLLHFGTFHLIALYWQRAGVEARPIMNAPLLATSLGDLWGNRWNTGFRELSHALVFQPLRRSLGTAVAGLAAFLASGLIHELVISVPARAGYGLPTAYFLIQGIGVLIQRSGLGLRFGLSGGLKGWLFTAGLAAGPLFWLFHPAFVTRVAVPFMDAIGAL